MISARRKPSTQALGHPAPPEQKTTTQSKRVADLKDQAWGSSGNRSLLLGLPLPTAVDISGEERDGVCQYLPSRRLENGHPMQAAAKTRLFWSLGSETVRPRAVASIACSHPARRRHSLLSVTSRELPCRPPPSGGTGVTGQTLSSAKNQLPWTRTAVPFIKHLTLSGVVSCPGTNLDAKHAAIGERMGENQVA